MNDLKGWITGVCLSLLIAGLIKLLAPGGSMGKLMQMLLALFVLCALCVPLAGGLPLRLTLPETESGNAPAQELEGLREALERQTQAVAAEKIKERIAIVLGKYGVQDGKISIGMDRTEDGSIFISEIVIQLPDEKSALFGEIGRTIKTELGLDAIILPEEA